DIADDVASFYDFGTIRHDARGLQRAPNRGATVHFGTRTSAEFATATSSPTITSPQAGVHGQFPATHFTVVAEEPLTGIRVGRTYFVGTGKCAARIVDPDAIVSPADSKLDRTVVAGASVGALIVGDSILVHVASPAASDNLLVLTASSFPYLRTWVQAGMEADFASHVDDVLTSDYMVQLKVGRPIGTSVSHAQILVQSEHLHVIEGTLQPYAHGFVLTSAHCPPLVVSFPTHVSALRILATPHEQLLLVVVDFTEDNNPVAEWLPCATSSSSIALPLVAGSRMQELLLAVLDVWKATAAAHDIPFVKPNSDETVADIKDRFFPQWSISKAPAQVSTWTKSSSSMVVPVTVFLGLPGSEVRALAASLAELTASANVYENY
ncbi:hypothetical protein DYB28_011834, partial [Aphanomyces astaci]